MEDDLHQKVKRLVTIEVRARFLVNALLRERAGCVRGSTSKDIDEAIDNLLALFDIDRDFWQR